MALPLDKLNKLLRTAALGVEVVQTKSKGRGIIATRAHRAGAAVVPAGEPLAHSSKRAVNAFAGHGEFAGRKQRINQDLHAIDAHWFIYAQATSAPGARRAASSTAPMAGGIRS